MNIFNNEERSIINKFNLHNRKQFSKINNKKKETKLFLVEFNGWPAIHIVFSYLINYFKKEKGCRIIAYECFDLLNRLEPSWYKKYLWKFGTIFNLKTFKIFRSFGTDEFLKPFYTLKITNEAAKITKDFISKKPDLKKLENLKVKDIWIGDLIYDSFLKKNSLSSIDINSINFSRFLEDCIKLFLFWEEFFEKNDVKGICVCHAVYLTGIPLRIANSKNIKCFSISNVNCNLINLTKSISYKKKTNGTDLQHRYYKKIFNQFPKRIQKKYLIEGKKILNDFTSGKKKYFYLKKSTFNNNNAINYKFKNSKVKVAIFSHDFVDSPHIHGNHFFSDFKEWFKFLEKIIKQTNYEWYIKEHPASNDVTKKEIYNLIKRNKNLKLIRKNFPNDKLKKIGINFVLTVYGTVASELPIYGIKVINASKNNPHFGYNFCINPESTGEYKKILLNLKKNNTKIKYDELYSFHFMKYLIFKYNLFFQKPEKYFNFINKKPLQFTYKMYKYWLKDFNTKNHNYLLRNLKEFIKSGNYLYVDTKKYNS